MIFIRHCLLTLQTHAATPVKLRISNLEAVYGRAQE